MSWHVSPWVYPVLDSLCLLDLVDYFLFHGGTFSNSQTFSYPFFSSSSSRTPIIQVLVSLMLSQKSLYFVPFLSFFFPLFYTETVFSTILSSRSLVSLSVICLMCVCESWTIKKAECWRINAIELWCWRRLLRVPCTSRRSSLSVLKEISPEYSWEGLMLKLKLPQFGHLMWRTDSLE